MHIWQYIPSLMQAAATSVTICLLSLSVATILAFVAGLSIFAGGTPARIAAVAYVEIFRGTSLLVQLFWLFYALPLVGLTMPPMLTGVLALGLNSGAYGAEVVRGALRAVSQNQHEAAKALNFTRYYTLTRIILPQSVPEMIPSFSSLAVQNLKDTSLVSMITIVDLAFKAQEIRNLTQDTVAVYSMTLVMYFAMAMAIVAASRVVETRVNKALGKHA